MARAAWFLQRQRPNRREAAAVVQIRTLISEWQQSGFQYLIGYGWDPGRCIGDLLFTDGTGSLFLVQGAGSSRSRGAAEQQAMVLAEVLVFKYPGCWVRAAV
jgi:hypothetical protein